MMCALVSTGLSVLSHSGGHHPIGVFQSLQRSCLSFRQDLLFHLTVFQSDKEEHIVYRILNRKLASHLWLLLLIVITFLQSGCSNLSLQQKPQVGDGRSGHTQGARLECLARRNEVTEVQKILKVIDLEADVVLMRRL